MARWRLTQPHYLRVPGTKWRYEETDRETGERAEQTFEIPRFLDPNNPRDCRSTGVCVVSYAQGAQPRDWIFEGDPTPDMEPLDEEATKISASFEDKWKHPIDSLESQGGFGEALFRKLEQQLTQVLAGSKTPAVSVGGVSREEFEELQKQLATLMAKNVELESANETKKAAGGRRV